MPVFDINDTGCHLGTKDVFDHLSHLGAGFPRTHHHNSLITRKIINPPLDIQPVP